MGLLCVGRCRQEAFVDSPERLPLGQCFADHHSCRERRRIVHLWRYLLGPPASLLVPFAHLRLGHPIPLQPHVNDCMYRVERGHISFELRRNLKPLVQYIERLFKQWSLVPPLEDLTRAPPVLLTAGRKLVTFARLEWPSQVENLVKACGFLSLQYVAGSTMGCDFCARVDKRVP